MPALHQQLYNRLFDAILGGEIAPGTRLAETTLAELNGVSRTVVRRTLQRLCDEGIVDIRPNRGATVNSVDAADARAIFQARQVVELGVVDLVCGRLDARRQRTLRGICAAEQRAMMAGERARGLRLSADFHLQLAAAAGNPLLLGYATNLMSRSALAIACLERPAPRYCAYGEHPELLDALVAGDMRRARRRMRSHLEHIASNLEMDPAHALAGLLAAGRRGRGTAAG